MCVCVCVLVCLFVFQCMGLLLSVYFTFYSYIIHFCHFLILATSECHFSFYVVFEKHGLAIKVCTVKLSAYIDNASRFSSFPGDGKKMHSKVH